MAAGMAVVMVVAWGIAPVSEAEMAVAAVWGAEAGSGEPVNDFWGRGSPSPRSEVAK